MADSLIENKSFPLADDLVGYFTVEYSTSHPKKEHEVKNYAALALFYHFRSLSDSKKALAVGSFLLSNAQVLSDKYRAGLYNDLGICYAMGQKYDSATTCIKLAVPLLQKLHDSATLARSLNSLGNIHLMLKKLPEALDYYNQSLAINSKVQSLSGMALNLLNIAIVLEDTHRPDSAKKVLQQALPLASKAGRKRIVADVANNLGSIYFVEKMYDSAAWYYTLAAEQKQDSDPYSSLSISINRA
ncbi:MAG: tetratricopeptide repeat protein, partial [Bacteroidales bacterium]|nr:tetratricopeptide repeat protein [Bacteroidales bacterium]